MAVTVTHHLGGGMPLAAMPGGAQGGPGRRLQGA